MYVMSEGDAYQGTDVSKVGRTTGRTAGEVLQTCVHVDHDEPLDFYLLCAWITDLEVDYGDSGGPVVEVTSGTQVRNVGLVQGFNPENSSESVYTSVVEWKLALSGSWCTTVYCAPDPGIYASGPTLIPEGGGPDVICDWTASTWGGVPPYSITWSGIGSGSGIDLHRDERVQRVAYRIRNRLRRTRGFPLDLCDRRGGGGASTGMPILLVGSRAGLALLACLLIDVAVASSCAAQNWRVGLGLDVGGLWGAADDAPWEGAAAVSGGIGIAAPLSTSRVEAWIDLWTGETNATGPTGDGDQSIGLRTIDLNGLVIWRLRSIQSPGLSPYVGIGPSLSVLVRCTYSIQGLDPFGPPRGEGEGVRCEDRGGGSLGVAVGFSDPRTLNLGGQVCCGDGCRCRHRHPGGRRPAASSLGSFHR